MVSINYNECRETCRLECPERFAVLYLEGGWFYLITLPITHEVWINEREKRSFAFLRVSSAWLFVVIEKD